MSITMQGPWTVSVKSKNAAFAQRFIIAGAASGNGTFAGEITTPPVAVTGDHWTITIQNNPGTGFQASQDQIRFPFVAGGQYHFDIESNDAGGDEDFNDLILRCHTPVTLTDFLIYGHVSYYDETCIFNPCFPLHAVIDSRLSLREALRNPDLRVPIEKLYPERVPRIGPPDPGPLQEAPFRALVIPIEEETAIPPKRVQILKPPPVPIRGADAKPKAAKDSAEPDDASVRTVTATQTARLAGAKTQVAAFDRVGLARIIDHIRRFCETGPLPGVALRFQEYDRTSAERAGGTYTGTGAREPLGACVTDSRGNYIFRFSRDLGDFLDELFNDFVIGDGVVQVMPDIIVQMLDPTRPGGVGFESAPYWNVPLFRRINICIPQSVIHRPPTACEGHNAIQALGRIPIGPPTIDPTPPGLPPGYGPRVRPGSFLGAEGRITVTNNISNVPQPRCAAWENCVDFFACFTEHPNVKQYTIRWRRHTGGDSFHFFTESLLHDKPANLGLPDYIGDLVGPHDSSLHIDGLAAVTAPAYFNIENDPAWASHLNDLKGTICTGNYAPTPMPIDFRIEGYDAAGNKVAGADDTITMYIDNDTPDFDIDSVEMLGAPGGDCALFTLPVGDERAPLTVRFKANELFGFMSSYSLSVRKGNTSQFSSIDDTPAGLSHGAYTHGDNLACSNYFGTRDAIGNFGLATIDLRPPGTTPWLEPHQPFCTFAVNLGCSKRATNGYNTAVRGYGTIQYLLGIQRSTP